jgi:hypothetical protein
VSHTAYVTQINMLPKQPSLFYILLLTWYKTYSTDRNRWGLLWQKLERQYTATSVNAALKLASMNGQIGYDDETKNVTLTEQGYTEFKQLASKNNLVLLKLLPETLPEPQSQN